MDKRDQEIQERILKQWSSGHDDPGLMSEDEQTYHKLFGALREEPLLNIPIDFSKKVTIMAIKRMKIRVFLKNTFHISLLSIFVLGVTMAALFFISDELVRNIWMILMPFKIPIIFGLMVFLAIQLIDKIFILRKADLSF